MYDFFKPDVIISADECKSKYYNKTKETYYTIELKKIRQARTLGVKPKTKAALQKLKIA